MAYIVKKSASFLALIVFVFAVISTTTAPVEGLCERASQTWSGAARLCERVSQTWSGSCRNTQGCNRQCKNWEDAAHGACHTRNGKKMCFCYFGRNC
ncbi:hypothetical protein MKX01_007801 [Papaver californicum]|nr:hypothetical protein MKX01_007801 [Papaver californicum]